MEFVVRVRRSDQTIERAEFEDAALLRLEEEWDNTEAAIDLILQPPRRLVAVGMTPWPAAILQSARHPADCLAFESTD